MFLIKFINFIHQFFVRNIIFKYINTFKHNVSCFLITMTFFYSFIIYFLYFILI